jgi:hypothetical protein
MGPIQPRPGAIALGPRLPSARGHRPDCQPRTGRLGSRPARPRHCFVPRDVSSGPPRSPLVRPKIRCWQPRCPRTAAGWLRQAGFQRTTDPADVAINSGFAAIMSIEPATVLHPFVAQCFGLATRAVNVASPWEPSRLAAGAAVAIGALAGYGSSCWSWCWAYGLRARRARLGFAQVPVDALVGLLERPLRESVLPAQVPRDARRGGAAPCRGGTAPPVGARARVRAQADAGAGRAALPLQHAGFGPIPD